MSAQLTHLPSDFQTAQLAWNLAMDITVDRANFMYPSESKRIASGRKILETGKVVIGKDGAKVQSQRGLNKTYSVNGTCQCEAFGYAQDRGDTAYRCAHRWAYLLYWKAIDRLTKLSCATYDDISGFVYALPEDGGYVFMEAWSGQHHFLPHFCSALVIHGKCAWIEDGKVRGMVPQAAQDGTLL